MRKLIARIFDLIPEEDYDLLQEENNSQRIFMETLRARFSDLEKSLTSEREERQKLQEIIFQNYGVTHKEENFSPAHDARPIALTKERWSSLKTRMELDDRRRVHASEENGRP